MYVSLQEGLYDLCRLRIEKDEEFKAQSARGNFDAVDDALFDEYKLWQLKKTVRRVRTKSPFYRRLFEKAGVTEDDLHSLADIAKLPFTFPADLAGTSYSLLCTSQGEVEKPVTFYSSGSTGTKKRIFFSMADIQKILDFLPRGMNTVIGRDEARVLVFLQNSQGRGIGSILAQSLNAFGMQGWTADLQDSTDDILCATVEHKINVWFGDAITIYRATRVLEKQADLRSLGMQCIFITMSNIPQSMIDYLHSAWGCRVSTHYGLTESGWGLAVDCDVCPGYHYDELDHIVEVVDPETGGPVPEGQEGEVVLTNISRDCMPLIRYRTGDIATLTRSVCGSHLMTLGHIRRRKEGATEYNGHYIYPALFDEVLFSTDGLLDYRIFLEGGRISLEVEVLDEALFDAVGLKERLMALPFMAGAPEIELNLLKSGALREHCYEKKRILERESHE
ncbi:MAG: DVU_1553 family AMP-dependent CoA ligase [Oscillospiraceae bacterium]|nr:AMP-binding protein [Oscillospiraceae bacterium]